jgi:DNA helicase-2/ATP-dependent DNA helicase PcrA
MRKQLTVEQLPAATSKAALTFIKAAPGSGKTFMSVERFGWLRYYHLAHEVRGIAAVSFARSASVELRNRIAARWGPAALTWPSFVSTFDELHRMVLRFLLANGHIRWPGGHVSLKVYETWRRFANTKQQGTDHKPLRAAVNSSGNVEPVPLGSWPRPKAYFIDASHYLAQLSRGTCTHDELRSVLTSVLLDDSPDLSQEVKSFLRRSFAHLLVDEVFDLNRLDTRLLQLVVDAGIQLTLIGDPWQSIFEWRGSTPQLVEQLLKQASFHAFPVAGSHRYRTEEMRRLASQLFRGKPFMLSSAEPNRRPDVVLAEWWRALWATESLPILPCGFGRLDQTRASAALILLLNDLTMELFDVPAADVHNALAVLNWTPDRRQLFPARRAIADPSAKITDVWAALYQGLGRPRGWGSPRATAGERLQILIDRVRSNERLILGTTTHQAKGLEWPAVDYVSDLPVGIPVRLDQNNANDRCKYVALTRAQDSVRVRPLPQEVVRRMQFTRRGRRLGK